MTLLPDIDPARLLEDLEANLGLPAHLYRGAPAHELDLHAVFRRHWQYFCPSDRVARPGDVAVGQVGEIPVVVTRDRDGVLHGLVNICRHRGYRVAPADAEGCTRLICRYHAWTYGLDGRLARAPGSEDEPGFPADELSLKRVCVAQWGHMIMVHADPEAAAFPESHSELGPAAERAGVDFDPANYVFVGESIHNVASNWKLWYDNYVECYHCDNIHQGSFAAAYESGIDRVETDFHRNFMSSRYSPKPVTDPTALRAGNYRSLNIFPCFHILQHDDLMFLSRLYPTGPESARQVIHYYRETDTPEGRLHDWIELWDQTFREDCEATSIQQAGLRSGAVERSRLLPVRERAVQFFNRLILEAYARYLDGPEAELHVAAE